MKKIQKEKEKEAYIVFSKGEKMIDKVTSSSGYESNVNERKKRKHLIVNQLNYSSATRYLGYLYYHGCYLLIDSSTNRQVDIHEVGRVTNANYLS